ncbi:MAG: NUDIX hydrolase [Chloroflexota bacterium]|nr:NUDIX hydrolase [Chloroflexota bacterium]
MTDLLDLSGANPWHTQSSRVVFDNGRLRLCEDRVLQPDGEQGSYTYLQMPWPVVAIVPVSDDGFVYLVRQWRYPWQRNSWEIPAGHCERDEQALHGAQRELAEEVGLEAAAWEPLGSGFSSAAVNARYHLFLARALAPATGEHHRDGVEHDLIARQVPLREAVEAAMDGRIEHGMSALGILRAARRLGV